MRGDTFTLHQRAGHDWVIVHAWNEPGRKNGKEPKNSRRWKLRNASRQCWMRHVERRRRVCYRIARWSDDTLKFHNLNSLGITSDRRIVLIFTSILSWHSGNGEDMENQELESTLISDSNGKSARKWFISLQTQDLSVAESPLMHECGGAGVVRRRGGRLGRTRAQKQSRFLKSAVAPPSERIKHVLV